MRRYLPGLLCCLLLTACRKDLVQYRSATRITSGTQNRLNSILFVNDTLGFIAGGARFEEADILITRDGGQSWSLYISPDAHKEQFGIAQSPAGEVYFIGFDGQMLRTHDGRDWQFYQLRFEVYKALAFANARQAVAVGGVSFERGDVMHVDGDGNVNGYEQLDFELNDIALLPSGSGWRCGYGAMQHTSDGGATWTWQSPRNDNYTALDVHSELIAYTCGGQGSIAVTRNGGVTWETLRNGADITHPKYRLQDLVFVDEQHGYAVGESGKVIFTDDAGRHWSELESFTSANLHGIARAPGGDLIICGEGGEVWRISR